MTYRTCGTKVIFFYLSIEWSKAKKPTQRHLVGLDGEAQGPAEKLSRNRNCFEEGKQAFQNAYRAQEKKQEDAGVPEGQKGSVQPRLLKPKKNKKDNILLILFSRPTASLSLAVALWGERGW